MKKTVIAAAVAATLGHTAANAVSVNPNGLGQVLIYPYYTVQGSAAGNFDSLITVVNTTKLTKAVKIRFREAKASWEVLDFNLYLSPNDVWVGVISQTNDGAGAMLTTPDTSCTVPQIPADGVKFRNLQYDPAQGGIDDGAGTGLDRTKEGYIEIIEMGTVIDDLHGTPAGASPSPFTPEAWALHSAGVPADCASLTSAWGSGSWNVPPAGFTEGELNVARPTGGLFGTISLINVNEGTDYGSDAVALEDFFSNPFNPAEAIHFEPGSTSPDFRLVAPKISNVLAGNTVITSNWTGSVNAVDPVTAVLMTSTLANDYVTEASIQAATSFVYTHPTKNFYVGVGIGAPFDRPFTNYFFGSACEEVLYTAWDREEDTERPQVVVDFSPRPPVINNPEALCFEANVVNINKTGSLSSQTAINEVDTKFDNGWMLTDLTTHAGHRMTDNEGRTYQGLPVVGFSAQRYFNGTLSAGTLSNYGGLFSHKTGTIITDSSGALVSAPARTLFPNDASVLSQ